MYEGRLVFSQVLDFLPQHVFRKLIKRYGGDRKVRSFSCSDQYRCMAFAQLTYRESLRDIETCLRAQKSKLYHMGIRGRVSRSTLADANETRDWRIYADLAQSLIREARLLYREEEFGIELDNTVYALDATTIDLCLAVFPWARFRTTKAAVKLHTLLDVRGNIPTFIHISDGKMHDVRVLDVLVPEPGAFYVMDRGYLDFERLATVGAAGAFFVIRGKSNMKFRRIYSRSVDKDTGLRCDQTIRLTDSRTASRYPTHLRRVKFYDAKTDKRFVFLTNNFSLPAMAIAELYRSRWQVELFFKWIKQHLRIKAFFGTSENAVKTQIWIAVSVYLLVAILRKRLKIDASLYTILQILSLTSFEQTQLNQLLTGEPDKNDSSHFSKQLILFDL